MKAAMTGPLSCAAMLNSACVLLCHCTSSTPLVLKARHAYRWRVTFTEDAQPSRSSLPGSLAKGLKSRRPASVDSRPANVSTCSQQHFAAGRSAQLCSLHPDQHRTDAACVAVMLADQRHVICACGCGRRHTAKSRDACCTAGHDQGDEQLHGPWSGRQGLPVSLPVNW